MIPRLMRKWSLFARHAAGLKLFNWTIATSTPVANLVQCVYPLFIGPASAVSFMETQGRTRLKSRLMTTLSIARWLCHSDVENSESHIYCVPRLLKPLTTGKRRLTKCRIEIVIGFETNTGVAEQPILRGGEEP